MSALKSSQLLQAKLAKYKMNPQYPSFNQIKHDALVRETNYNQTLIIKIIQVTTSASCCGAAVEILLCHLWAVNKLPAFQVEMDGCVSANSKLSL